MLRSREAGVSTEDDVVGDASHAGQSAHRRLGGAALFMAVDRTGQRHPALFDLEQDAFGAHVGMPLERRFGSQCNVRVAVPLARLRAHVEFDRDRPHAPDARDGTLDVVLLGVAVQMAAQCHDAILDRDDENLNVFEGSGMPSPANRFHAWIYREHPDVHCVIHTHPEHISALSMLGRPLEIAHMDTCVLYGDVAYLDAWPGIPVGNGEGKMISAALGSKRAILLAHHGLLVACRSVEEACVVAIQCERAATLQLLASPAGEIKKIDPILGQEAHDWLLEEKRVQATFYYFARKILQQFPDCLVR